MNCSTCGAPLRESAKFCPSCGSGIAPVQRNDMEAGGGRAVSAQPQFYRYQESIAFKTIAQANDAANELHDAKEDAAILRVEYEEERAWLRRMVIGGIVIAGAFLSFFTAFLMDQGGDVLSEWSPLQFALGIPLMYLLTALAAVALAAGFVGVWRRMTRSGFFVFGGVMVMYILCAIVTMVAAYGGPFFLFGQWRRVKKCRAAVQAAEERVAQRAAIIA